MAGARVLDALRIQAGKKVEGLVRGRSLAARSVAAQSGLVVLTIFVFVCCLGVLCRPRRPRFERPSPPVLETIKGPSDSSSTPKFSQKPRRSARMCLNQPPPSTCACGSVFMADSVFCRKCGASRQTQPAQCACGNSFMADSTFCRKCGAMRQDQSFSASHSASPRGRAPFKDRDLSPVSTRKKRELGRRNSATDIGQKPTRHASIEHRHNSLQSYVPKVVQRTSAPSSDAGGGAESFPLGAHRLGSI